jgi:hypothetical protein
MAWAVKADEAPAGGGGMDVLTRGPVHEAFAEPAFAGRNEGLVVDKQPPQPIDEMPPDARPEGENVIWIPGYWAWDPERNDFLWVSGLWRAAPPGQSWVPGYWLQAEGGWRWVPGFWSRAEQQQQEVTYLPQPPESLEQGPNTEAPAVNYFWIPGVWNWQDVRYVWRPGYWAPVQANWIWVPDRYCWAPRGWIYLTGYWDYPVAERGLLFSPVAFTQPLYLQPNYVYTPSVVVDVNVLTSQMFCWPRYHHYCFGDWYAPHWEQRGIYPWYTYQERRTWYDPLFVYYRWHNHHRGNEHWERDLRRWNDYFRDHPHHRPPHTLAQQRDLRGRVHDEALLRHLTVARPLNDLRAGGNSWVRLGAVSQADRQRYQNGTREFNDFRRQRQTLEGRGVAQGGRIRAVEKPETLRLPNLPNIARNAGQAANQRTAGKLPGTPGERTERMTRRPETAGGSGQPGAQPQLGQPKQPTERQNLREGMPSGERPRTFEPPNFGRDRTPPTGPRTFDRSTPSGPSTPQGSERGRSFERRDYPGGGLPQGERNKAFDRSSTPGQNLPQGGQPRNLERQDLRGSGTPPGDRLRSFGQPGQPSAPGQRSPGVERRDSPQGGQPRNLERQDLRGSGTPPDDRLRSFGQPGQPSAPGQRSPGVERRTIPGAGTPPGDGLRSFNRQGAGPQGNINSPYGGSGPGPAARTFDRPNPLGGGAGGSFGGLPERRESRMPIQRPESAGPSSDAGRGARNFSPGISPQRSGGGQPRTELRGPGGPDRSPQGPRPGEDSPRRGKPER